MLGIYYKFKYRLTTMIYIRYIKLRYNSIKIGSNLKIFGRLLLSVQKDSKVIIGDNVIFRSATKYNYIGINKPVSIAVNNKAELLIGNNTGFSGNSIFVFQKVHIGNNCNVGGNSAIWDTDFHPLEYKARRINDVTKINSAPIVIGNDVFIGANSIILKGVTIGDRAIIGAGSVVSKNIPPDEIWAGNPARFIRKTESCNIL